jgi:hypothetical protein
MLREMYDFTLMKQGHFGVFHLMRSRMISHMWGMYLCIVLPTFQGGGLENKIGCGTEQLYARGGVERGEIKSPDGSKAVAVHPLQDEKDPDGYITYDINAGNKHFTARLSGFRTEVLWSPDSNAFAVNQTEGGGGIGQRTYIFEVSQGRLRRIDASARVEKAFGFPVKCEAPAPPNTATIKWLDSKRILVAAQVVPVSICRCSGTFKTYEVLLPEVRILRVYGQAESERLFGDALGCELRRADDSCAKTWQK